MQTLKKASEKVKKEKSKETEVSSKKLQDEKHKKSIYTVSTPRSYMQKSSTADIYGQNKNVIQAAKAPKKSTNTTQKSSNVSPMKDLLKSSSSVSVASRSSDSRFKKADMKTTPRKATQIMSHTTTKSEAKPTPRTSKILESRITPRTGRQTPRRELPFSNVTVSSPPVKRKLNLEKEMNEADNKDSPSRINRDEQSKRSSITDKNNAQLVFERQRTKTRTLDDDEVKILTPEIMDNNAEMINLTRKLTAKPKAFFVDLDDDQNKKKKDVPSEEEVSYEDDFESYESDFESYHSETTNDDNEKSSQEQESSDHDDDKSDHSDVHNDPIDSLKEVRDEERMLDSGSYDLRDRSAKSKPSIMEDILEDSEDGRDKKVSLTDEGFQEMSSSSAVSSLRTVHVDVLERPLFLDFKKSKEVKRKRRIFEQLKKRATDLLGMISLHEMTYFLFEMKPISYDLYIATFGRQNYMQTGVQTFDDGVSEEVQCDEITRAHKWTQNPVEFSKSDIYLNYDTHERRYSVVTVDYLTKFSFLTQQNEEDMSKTNTQTDENYRINPLRIYLEQKDGVGSTEMLAIEKYKAKLNDNKYDSHKLSKFLKKMESRLSNVLSSNIGSNKMDLVKSTKIPFSKGFVPLSIKNITNENYNFLKNSKITQMFFSETKSNLIMTVHNVVVLSKYLMCLWDASIAIREPTRILVAIDSVIIGRFRGSADGIVVAGLEDGTIHLWDLSEEPNYNPEVSNEPESTALVDVKSDHLTEFEKDREWNLKNVNIKNKQQFHIHCALQACAYTNSAHIMSNGEVSDRIVGLEFTSPKSITLESGRKIVGQVVSLQRIGILITWTIVQERNRTNTDIGKAYWSKIKLERLQAIDLSDYIENGFASDTGNTEKFHLNSAKKRLMNNKQDRSLTKNTRQKSARVTSARNRKDAIMLPTHNIFNTSIICTDLKITTVNDTENFLVAKNCGEILCCKRCLGVFKVHRFSVTNDASSVTSLQVSPHGLPHFLAATDTGTIHLCSLLEKKVLHTLDGRNVPPSRELSEKYQSDAKGRFVGTVSVNKDTAWQKGESSRMSVKYLLWSQVNPCCIYAILNDGTVVAWDLAQSDIYGKTGGEKVQMVAAGDSSMAILTRDEEVQIHRFNGEQRSNENLELFKKYVTLL